MAGSRSVVFIALFLLPFSARAEEPSRAGRAQVEVEATRSVQAERVHPGRPVGKMLALPSAVFTAGDAVRISWFDAPGNPQDWVTVVPVGTPDDRWGDWVYTGGKAEGTMVARGLKPGDWEARLYLDWPKGGFRVVDRLAFMVLPRAQQPEGPPVKSAMLYAASPVFLAEEAVEVGWHHTPGHPTDWLTAVPQGTPDDRWGPWMYTGPRKQGSFQIPPMRAGRYELRLYFEWPKGQFEVRDRLTFTVR